ncbi:pectin lyase-like protein, partial [Trichodelitschia bisporula]
MAYWMADPKYAHKQPLAGSADYPVLRNVKAYGAKGDGVTDDWAAIMSAVTRGGRCGEGCNATSTKGAVVYFPPGKYLITKPIIQYYFTVFAGDPSDRAVILGAKDFKGIALVDTDVYIPESNGQNWWINQNNFYRQIRNLVLDLTLMPNYVEGGVGNGFPAGIHWQVSQACTLHNLDFKMPTTAGATHRGVFMENGSGGFVSDLSFTGGAVGFVAGSQQYTARNLRFSKCQTAIEMLWSWGFTWKSMLVSDCKVGINATGFGVDGNTQKKQSTGSLIVQGSSFTNVDTMLIVLQTTGYQATVLLENIELAGSSRVAVASNTGDALLAGGPQKIPLWGLGRRFDDASPEGRITMGPIPVPKKDPGLLLLDDWYEREKPMYHREPAGNFINVLDFGVKNDGTSAAGNARGINEALAKAAGEKKVLVFPAGIYLVDETLFIPSGTRMVGVLWSQIVATGAKFADPDHPYILASRVGQPGDVGAVEISDMLFTQSGPTAGAVLMEWNIYQSNQGSAAMFDVIFRVGGAAGSGLLESNCHQFGAQKQESCMAAAMMLHVRSGSSIYMENMWFWVAGADHDVESKLQTRINIYGARGVLIESQGPSWVYSVSNEHSTLYNWQLAGANNIYLGHIQSETPYFQAGQTPSLRPYPPSEHFAYDPEFADCGAAKGFDTCREAWALRVIKSRNVYLYGGGFYAFFTDYKDDCAKFGGVCQDRLIDTDYSEGVWMFNLFTVGGKEVISPQGDADLIPSLKTVERKTEENGFATATNAWLLLSNKGATIGGTRKGALERQDEEPGPLMCNFNLEFPTFDALDKASSTMDPYCVYIAGIATSGTMIETALSEYNKTKPGYDDLFNAYSKVFRSYMAREIKDFM